VKTGQNLEKMISTRRQDAKKVLHTSQPYAHTAARPLEVSLYGRRGQDLSRLTTMPRLIVEANIPL